MMAVPRKQDSFEGISINSLGTIGMLLAKSDKVLEKFKQTGPQTVLENIGFPTVDIDQQEKHYDY
jgi:ATP adenylyltransferase